MKIWVVLQQKEGELHRMSREAIAAAQQLAAATGAGAVDALILGSGIGSLAEEVAGAYALGAVRFADHVNLANYTPGGYVGALQPAIATAAPDLVLFPHTYQSVDYMARLAQALGAGLLPEITAFEDAEGGMLFTRPVLGGKLDAKVRIRGEGTVLISIQSGAFAADSAQAGSGELVALGGDLEAAKPDREILGVEEVGGEHVDLTKAEVIVAAGRGVGSGEKMKVIEELAEVLGAEIAASRPVIDNGWLERDRQIGSSGQTVAPKLYIAAGISGAIQHTVGMKGASVVVSVNKDPGAPIFNLSNYGIVGDLHEVLPALTEAIRQAKE